MEDEEERLRQEAQKEFKINIVKFELATGRNNESFNKSEKAEKVNQLMSPQMSQDTVDVF